MYNIFKSTNDAHGSVVICHELVSALQQDWGYKDYRGC